MSYFVGDVVMLRATFTDSDGALFTPSTITFKVQLPNGTVSTLSSLSNPSTGVYTKAYTVTVTGVHNWYATGTGTNAKSERGQFHVTSEVPS